VCFTDKDHFIDYILTLLDPRKWERNVVPKRRQLTIVRYRSTVFIRNCFKRVHEVQGARKAGLSLIPFDGVFELKTLDK
jgi:hypothetical protein